MVYGEQTLTVSQLNLFIKDILGQIPILNNIKIKGEISNFKHHSSGHMYMSLKDENGVLRAVMFRANAMSLTFRPENGMQVIAEGRVSVYERDGQYQLYINSMEQDGKGNLYEQFEKLKAKLQKEGLFDQNAKKPIPRYPKRIGVITAPTGAAVREIINILSRRFKAADICLCPALVQGDGAAESIKKAIEYFNSEHLADVLIVGRGGGSIEDLWAFNERIVAEAVFHCSIPIISAVGHETDTTIIDFVSDLRAPTPSAAAELAVFDVRAFWAQLEAYQGALHGGMHQRIREYRVLAEQYTRLLRLKHPMHQIREQRQQLLVLEERLQSAMKRQIEYKRNELRFRVSQLKGLSPLEKLEQGLAYVSGEDGSAVHSVEQAELGSVLNIQLKDGRIHAVVTGKEQMDVKEKYIG